MAVLIITLIIATMFGVNADEYRPTSEAVRSVKVDDPDGTNTKHSNSNPPISNTERVLRPLDSESRDLLQKFDDFLFSNLENLYYRFRYVLKCAVSWSCSLLKLLIISCTTHANPRNVYRKDSIPNA